MGRLAAASLSLIAKSLLAALKFRGHVGVHLQVQVHVILQAGFARETLLDAAAPGRSSAAARI